MAYDRLWKAIQCNNYRKLKEILNKGVCINIVNKEGYSPLHIASGSGYEDIVLLLLKKGANINITVSETGETPLILAIKNKRENIVNILLKNKANVNLRLSMGYTALHWAVILKNIKIIELLLENGADVNVKDIAYGYSPLHLSVIHYNEESSNKLIDVIQNNIERINEYGPGLEYGCFSISKLTQVNTKNKCDKLIIYCLLKKGADINSKNWDDETPLHCAARRNDIFLSKFLMEKGAKVTIQSTDGDLPHDLISNENCVPDFIMYMVLYDYSNISGISFINNCDYSSYFKNCQNEVEKMQRTVFTNSNVSMYNFLRENNEIKLECYLRNTDIQADLEEEKINTLFPIYNKLFKLQIHKGLKRVHLTEMIINHFYTLMHVRSCWIEILRYLNTSDLENLVIALNSS